MKQTRRATHAKGSSRRRELERIAEEATVDSYGEYEQTSAWCEYLQDVIGPGRRCTVGRKEGTLMGFDTNKNGTAVLAVVKVDGNEYKVAAETISVLDKEVSKYLEAFKEWL